MIRKKQKRAARGKQTAFRRSGQNVDPKRITRFVRRYGSTWVKNRDKDAELQSPEPSESTKAEILGIRSGELTQLAAGTPSDMSCYTPEPEDDVATPVSPPDLQSPTRETPYPMGYGTSSQYQKSMRHNHSNPRIDQNHIDSIPDLVMDDEHAFPMAMHNHQRRVYHPSDPVAHSIAHQGVHVTHPGMHLATHPSVHPTVHAPVPPPMHRAVHPPPMLHTTLHQPLHSSVHSVHPSVRSSGHPVVTQIPAPAPISSHHHHHHHDDVDAPGEVTHPDDWNRLDVFQNRLNRLGSTLEESMAKWSSRDQDPNQEVPHHEGLGL